MPVIRTLSFANYRTPTQTDWAKKGILAHRTSISRLCVGQAGCQPCLQLGLPLCRPHSQADARLAMAKLAASKWLQAQSTGLATLAERILSHNPSSSPALPVTSAPRWGHERSAPTKPLGLKMRKGKFQLGQKSGGLGKPHQNVYCPFWTTCGIYRRKWYTCMQTCAHMLYMHIYLYTDRHTYIFIYKYTHI